jgi:hypothetical protein
MNFFQMICCALLAKGSEFSNQYLETGYGIAQGYVRRQLRPERYVSRGWQRKLATSATLQTADQELRQFLNDAAKEAEETGNSLCKCTIYGSEAPQSPAPSPAPIDG